MKKKRPIDYLIEHLEEVAEVGIVEPAAEKAWNICLRWARKYAAEIPDANSTK